MQLHAVEGVRVGENRGAAHLEKGLILRIMRLMVGYINAERTHRLAGLLVHLEERLVGFGFIKLIKFIYRKRLTDHHHLSSPHIEIVGIIDVHGQDFEIQLIVRLFGGEEGHTGESFLEGVEELASLVTRLRKHGKSAAFVEDAGGEVEGVEVAADIAAAAVTRAESGQNLQKAQQSGDEIPFFENVATGDENRLPVILVKVEHGQRVHHGIGVVRDGKNRITFRRHILIPDYLYLFVIDIVMVNSKKPI